MSGQTDDRSARRGSIIWPAAVIVVTVFGLSLYANLPVLMDPPIDFSYFPPFDRSNRLDTRHLGAEYNAIAKSLVAGRGFADPFRARTGPTAWMPPMFSWLLAALWWDADGDITYVQTAVIILEDLTLIATGILIVVLSRRTTGGVWLATAAFVGALCYYFRHSFQFMHDHWVVLGALNVLIAGLVFVRPLEKSWRVAAGWGVVGGLLALTSPAVGFIWGLFALASLRVKPGGSRPAVPVAVLVAGLTVSPWVIRNYHVFGRVIPVKSNLAYEFYQSQCLQESGVLHEGIWQTHPNHGGNASFREYAQLGEMAFMDRTWERFRDSFRANPSDFFSRVSNRFQEATLVYAPFDPREEYRRPWMTWYARLVYPLPFVCIIGLAVTALWRPLCREQWIVIGVYLAYVMPYVVISYYERYKFPVMGMEAILLVWGIHRFLNLGTKQSASEPERLQGSISAAGASVPIVEPEVIVQ